MGREPDQNCEDKPKHMEKLLMDFCRTIMVGKKTRRNEIDPLIY
jgi:hypothetical protein